MLGEDGRVPEPGMTSQEMAHGQDETSQSLVCKRQGGQVWGRVRKGVFEARGSK